MRACCLSEKCRREAYVERRPQGAVADPWRCTPTAVQPLCANQDAANKWMLAPARVETRPFRCLKSLAANPQLISQQTAAKNLLAAGILQRTRGQVLFSAGWNFANHQPNQATTRARRNWPIPQTKFSARFGWIFEIGRAKSQALIFESALRLRLKLIPALVLALQRRHLQATQVIAHFDRTLEPRLLWACKQCRQARKVEISLLAGLAGFHAVVRRHRARCGRSRMLSAASARCTLEQ